MSTEPSLTKVSVERPVGGGRAVVRLSTSTPSGRPALQPMLLATDAAGARVSLVPTGALLLAGDAVRIEILVRAGARLELVEPAGTIAYAMHGASASWEVTIVLEPAATLAWAGEPFVVSAGARVTRTTRVRLGWGALVALREVLVLGRHGEEPGSISSALHVSGHNDAPVLSEALETGPGVTPLLLGGARAMGTVLSLGYRTPRLATAEAATHLDLAADGTVVRSLAGQAHDLQLEPHWEAAQRAMVSPPRRSDPGSRTRDRARQPSTRPG